MARVLTLDLNGETVAYPNDVLSEEHVINDTVGGRTGRYVWTEGTAYPLDSSTVAGGRDVGTAPAFSRLVDGNILEFTFDGRNEFQNNKQTGSNWNVFGHAIDGELKGKLSNPACFH